jgi:molybdopterin-guanine dinucleotide biosynthesis protein A
MTINVSDRRIALLTAGIGSRLGTITDKRNKGLISINNRAVVSHLIDRLPPSVPIVVALGHHGDQVRQYLEIAYPDRMFVFRMVDPYKGPGSSSGYSLYSLRDLLPGPFLFCTNDTIVRNDISFEGRNWAGVGISDDLDKYTRFSLFGNRATRIHRKGEPGGSIAYIGLAEIHDADAFWQTLGQALEKSGECSDVEGLFGLLTSGLYARMVDWLDTGNKDQFDQAVQALGGNGVHLPKEEEDLYFHDNRVIKFFLDKQKVRQRVERAHLLEGLVPRILGSSANYYSYQWVDGQMLSAILTPGLIQEFLDWGLENLWLKRDELSTGRVVELGRQFYLDKTLERLHMLFTSGWVQDRNYVINGVPCERSLELLKALDDDFFASARMVHFHGDLHPDNIIVKGDGSGFVFLDWRENYAGLLDQGDMYYDLAKLYHGLLVSHEYVKDNKLLVDIQDDVINIDIPVHYRNLNAISVLERWTQAKGLSLRRLRIIVALIYLNIAPLHHFPYIQFLYFMGNQLLEQELGGKAKA